MYGGYLILTNFVDKACLTKPMSEIGYFSVDNWTNYFFE
ncbi:hypothetical protein B6254_1418 [Weissella cibaria]|uniref:Uncharacterized protein n=1 Tax=Weissella cibaria TaxID=137591 RepID=A0A2S1KS52_9LACO|nr:hypothetical protein B6254_1418 [Weissella cibaria]